jgi:hypothetical protein
MGKHLDLTHENPNLHWINGYIYREVKVPGSVLKDVGFLLGKQRSYC